MAHGVPEPWFRKNRGWFVTVGGKQHNLRTRDKREAFERWHGLMSAAPAVAYDLGSDPLVVDLLAMFCEWAEKHLAPKSYEWCQALVSDFMPRTKQVCLGKHKRVRTQHNSTVRNIQVDEELLVVLARNARGKRSSDPLFAHESGRSWNQGEVNCWLRALRAVTTRAGEPIRDHITPYSFRDLYISELLMIGVEPFKVAKMAGTSLKEIDRTYGHFFNHDLAEAQERLAASRLGRF